MIHSSFTSAFYCLNSLSAFYVLFMVELSVDFFVKVIDENVQKVSELNTAMWDSLDFYYLFKL